MTRKDFIKACGLLGLSIPFSDIINNDLEGKNQSFSGKVIIVGSGAAGMSAGYILRQKGIDFKIIEATSQYGGRMKTDHTFADFPIPLGAEWISSINLPFGQLVDGHNASQKIQTVGYAQNDEYAVWNNGKLIRGTLNTFNDKKFVNTSWLGFFEEFIIPNIEEKIIYNEPVRSINYADDMIVLKSDKETYTADRVILTTPVSLLKDKHIQFIPALPKKKTETLESILYWDGFKAFFEFDQKFYPSFVDYVINPVTDGQVSLYDAAWGQKSDKNILGLFSVGAPAKHYGSLNKADFKAYALNEFDEIFDGQASRYYINHITQNWSTEAFAKGAYVSDYTTPKTIAQLQTPIDNKLFFAGDAYTNGYDWGNVHNAIASATQCTKEILNNT